MRQQLLIFAAFLLGGVVGWKINSRPHSVTATPDNGIVNYPTGDGRRRTVPLTITPLRANTHGAVELGPEEWWIEINGKVFVATVR